MTTNLVAQLKQANALDKLDEVRAEIARARAELGYPPLVTPTSQIIGVQAVQNVLAGRYKMITQETKDYCYGLYGRPPAPIDKEIQKIVLKDPELEKAKQESKEFARNIEDVLTYALFPITGSRFLKYKYGIDKTIPDDWKPPHAPKTLEEVREEDELIAKAKAGEVVAKLEKAVPERGPGVRTFNVFIENEYYKVDVEAVGKPPANPAPSPTSPSTTEARAKAKEKKIPPAAVAEGTEVPAPMPGMIIRYLVNLGDRVKAGDPLLILEAMKMQNNIPAPVDGVVKAINFEPGDSVSANDILAVIG